ncbi:hypothetical protein [Methyloterricola oryzae]|uniref:hypothetical protein n=1 Tax=Methyloterricola oryzae TaxID=1495050 RepID=UPI0005EB985A|nr:hypothetical protein [Methyloterricola oryzae]
MIKTMIVYLVPLFGIMPLPWSVDAGILSGGHWSAAACDQEPVPSAIESSGAEACNASLKRVRKFEQRAQAYITCVVQEANGDYEASAKAANAQPARFEAALSEIQGPATAINARLDRP